MAEEVHQDLDQDQDLPFYMSQIKTTGMTEEPDSERVNFVRARLEPKKEVTKSGQTTSEQVKSESVTSDAIAVPNAMEIAERKKAKQVKRAWRLWTRETMELQCLGDLREIVQASCVVLTDR